MGYQLGTFLKDRMQKKITRDSFMAHYTRSNLTIALTLLVVLIVLTYIAYYRFEYWRRESRCCRKKD